MAVTIPGNVRGGGLGIEAKADVAVLTGGGSVTWPIPPRLGIITVQVKAVSAGSYQIYTTASLTEDVTAGNADWFPMFEANQTADKQYPIHGAISAIKVVNITGTQRACIRGQ